MKTFSRWVSAAVWLWASTKAFGVVFTFDSPGELTANFFASGPFQDSGHGIHGGSVRWLGVPGYAVTREPVMPSVSPGRIYTVSVSFHKVGSDITHQGVGFFDERSGLSIGAFVVVANGLPYVTFGEGFESQPLMALPGIVAGVPAGETWLRYSLSSSFLDPKPEGALWQFSGTVEDLGPEGLDTPRLVYEGSAPFLDSRLRTPAAGLTAGFYSYGQLPLISYGTDAADNFSVVPEPSTTALILGALVCLSRRRQWLVR